jgi:hypothetical protein
MNPDGKGGLTMSCLRLPLLLSFAAGVAVAAPNPEFLPLEAGNQWIYKVSGGGGGHRSVEVSGSAEIDGRRYFLVTGLSETPALLRLSETGELIHYDRGSARETIWLRFSAGRGEVHDTSIHPCNRRVRTVEKDGTLKTPVGPFEGIITVEYPEPQCADAGLVRDSFAPSVGLLERQTTTIAGPQTMTLVYARVGKTVYSQPEVSFSIALDRSVYDTRLFTPVMTVRLTLRVTQPEPLELTFPSGQRFEIELRDESGELVHRWSDGKAFPLLFGVERVTGEKSWMAEIPLVNSSGNLFNPGRYKANGWLTTSPDKQYSATVAFEISSIR